MLLVRILAFKTLTIKGPQLPKKNEKKKKQKRMKRGKIKRVSNSLKKHNFSNTMKKKFKQADVVAQEKKVSSLWNVQR